MTLGKIDRPDGGRSVCWPFGYEAGEVFQSPRCLGGMDHGGRAVHPGCVPKAQSMA